MPYVYLYWRTLKAAATIIVCTQGVASVALQVERRQEVLRAKVVEIRIMEGEE